MQTTTHPALLSTDKSNSTRKSNLVTRIQAVKTSDRLSPSARLLLRSIADYCGNDSSCWPSCRRLATECGLSVRHVQRLLGELEAQGWIARGARHRDDGGQRSNLIRWTHQSAAQPAAACHPPLTSTSPLENSGKTQTHKKHNASCGLDENRTPAAKPPEQLQQPAEQPAVCPPAESLPETQHTVTAAPAAQPAWTPDTPDGGPTTMAAILSHRLPAAQPAPAAQAQPAPAAWKPVAAQPGSRFLTIQSEHLPNPAYVRQVYSAAVAAGLLRDSESCRLGFLASVCEVLRRYRAGKCRNPGGSLRWLLNEPRRLLEYPTSASETRARSLLLRVFVTG